MAWYQKNPVKTLKVTKKLADEWQTMDSAHVDRPLSERRLSVYKKVLEDGLFRPVTWAKVYCKETGQYYRVNGKHTSTLFSSIDLSKVQDLIAVIEDYECDSIDDVSRLYSTFDSQAQVRNATDINRSFSAVIPELCHCDTRFINTVVSALAYADNPGAHSASTSTNKTAAERAEALFDNVDFAIWLEKILGPRGKNHHLWRVPVVAAMKVTWHKAKGPASQFWEAVRDETGAKPELPDRKIAKFLTTTTASLGSRNGTAKRFLIQPREYYVKCIHAWNAWRKSESTNLQYYKDAKVPSPV